MLWDYGRMAILDDTGYLCGALDNGLPSLVFWQGLATKTNSRGPISACYPTSNHPYMGWHKMKPPPDLTRGLLDFKRLRYAMATIACMDTVILTTKEEVESVIKRSIEGEFDADLDNPPQVIK